MFLISSGHGPYGRFRATKSNPTILGKRNPLAVSTGSFAIPGAEKRTEEVSGRLGPPAVASYRAPEISLGE